MSENRLFVANPLGSGESCSLDAAQAHYLLNVLRLPQGATILVFNGTQGEWRATIEHVKKGRCILRCTTQLRTQTDPQDLVYAFAPLKQARLDYVIQKAVELGVSMLQPVMTARTAVTRLNLERMRANAIEAAEQCGVLTIPDIQPVIKLERLLETYAGQRAIVFCDENAPVASPLEKLASLSGFRITVLVGPEGGFSDRERTMIASAPRALPISLGPRIMRADTAAVAALALVNAVLGDWR